MSRNILVGKNTTNPLVVVITLFFRLVILSTCLLGFSFQAMAEETNGWHSPNAPKLLLNRSVHALAPSSGEVLKGKLDQSSLTYVTSSNVAAVNAFTSDPYLVALAAGLKNDPGLIYNFVRNEIEIDYTHGGKKGPLGTYLDRSGNVYDQAELLLTLLEIAGFDASFQRVNVVHSADQLAKWLKVHTPSDAATDFALISALLTRMGVTALSGSYEAIEFEHMVVKVSVDGTTYYLDPAFKTNTYQAGTVNIGTVIGFNHSNFVSEARNGQYIDRGKVKNTLRAYANNWINEIRQQHTSATVEDVLGHWRPSNRMEDSLENASNYIVSYGANWEALPNNLITTLRIRHRGIDQTFDSREIYTQRLAIYYPVGGSNPAPALYLDGQLIQTGSAAIRGSSNAVSFDINHPYASGFDNADQSWKQYIRAGGAFTIVNAWGSVGTGHTEFQQKALVELQNLNSQSEPLLNQSLMVMGLKWTANKNMADDFAGRMTKTTRFSLHTVGIAGTGDVTGNNGGPYVDVAGGMNGNNLDFGTSGQAGKFVAAGLLASAFEHGIIEQSQPFTAVSTVKLFDIALRNNFKLLEANSRNWNSIRSSLSGYSDLGALDQVINQGGRLLLPENGNLSEDNWQGTGYFSLVQTDSGMSAGYIIGGGFKGGFSTDTGKVSTLPVSEVVSQGDVFSSNPSVNRERILSSDGVFSQQDLVTGSGISQLALTRNYNGRDVRENGLGEGWSHNYNIDLEQTTNIVSALHEGTALDATASIVAMYVVDQLMQSIDDSLFDSVGLSAAVYQWLMDEYTDNAQLLSMGAQVQQYIRLPNGQYSSPKGVRNTLSISGGTYQLSMKNGTIINFNSNSKAASLIDRNNNTLTFNYDGENLERVTNSYARYLQFNYVDGLLASVNDENSRTIDYGYTNGVLTSYTNAEEEIAKYDYNDDGRLYKVYSPAYPNTPEYTDTYDIWGRKITRVKASGAELKYFYAPGYRNETLDALGNVHIRYFDDRNDLVKEVDALGQVVTYEYDSIHRRTVTTYDANGMQIVLAYDNENNITRRTRRAKTGSTFADRIESYTYTSFGNVLSHTNTGGDTTDYSYDSGGNLLTSQSPAVNGVRLTTTNTYHSNGLLASTTTPDGMLVNYAYDTKANLLTKTVDDPAGQNIVHTYTYKPTGDVETYRDPLGNTTTYNTYDNARRLIKQTSPTGEVTEFQYNANGLLTLQRKQAIGLSAHPSGWAATTFTHTRDNQLASQTDPQGNISRFSYDLMGNQTLAIDGAGRQNRVIYDALYRPLQAQRQLNGSFVNEQVNSYTATGQIASRTDGNGNTTIYAYDGHDQLATVTYPDGTSESYVYFTDGQLEQFTAQSGAVTSYQYDALNRVTQRQSGTDERLVYEYNSLGQQQRIRQYLPATSSSAIDISYTYDGISRLQSVTDGNNRTVQYGYDKLNRRTSLTFPDNQSVSYNYDDESRLTGVNYASQTLASYSYNKLSQLTTINFGNGTRAQLTFEADSDLASLMHSFSASKTLGYSFAYDGAGQVTSKQHQGEALAWLPLATYTQSYTTNSLNQTTRMGSDNFDFDGNGNLSRSVGLDYSHNALNQLTTISAQGVTGNITYQYDALGRRISKSVYGEQTTYLYDGDEVIAEYDANGNSTKRFIYGRGIDNPVAFITNNQTYYYHTDNIGSVVALSNSAGSIQEQYSYGPFGQSNDISLIGNPLRYTARRLDDETKHYYYRARYYEPSWGKFLQADPLGYQDGMNRYAYVGHSPTHLIDPMGTTAVAGGFSTSQGLVDTSVNIMHGFDAAWHNVVHGSSSSQELTWLSGAFSTASEYAGYAATAAVLVPGGQGAAGVLGTASLGFGLVSVGVDGINSYLNGSNFNQANAAGVGSGLSLNYISNAVSRAVPNRFSQPAAVAFDAVTQVSNFLFNTAAENERRAEQKRRREEEKRRQELYKLLHERR